MRYKKDFTFLATFFLISSLSATDKRDLDNTRNRPYSEITDYNYQTSTDYPYYADRLGRSDNLRNDSRFDSYNSQRSGITSPVYVEDYRSETDLTRPYPEYGGMTNLNREYTTTTDYDFNRASVITATSSATLTEAQLLGLLKSQERGIYLSLDPEGKALAIQLASQDSYKDKNLAVREAKRRMNERRGLMNR